MAYRVPPTLAVPPQFEKAIESAVRWKALQHQDELLMLLQFTQQLDPPLAFQIIVEIGTHQGGTLACWAELASDLVVGIDLPLGYGGPLEWGGLPLEDTLTRNSAFSAAYPRARNILGNSRDPATLASLLVLLDNRPIDLLFIDGDHTLAGVSADYLLYSPLVRSGGVVAFHDVNPCVRNVQQNFAVPDFFATLPSPRFVFSVHHEWGGIGAVVM